MIYWEALMNYILRSVHIRQKTINLGLFCVAVYYYFSSFLLEQENKFPPNYRNFTKYTKPILLTTRKEKETPTTTIPFDTIEDIILTEEAPKLSTMLPEKLFLYENPELAQTICEGSIEGKFNIDGSPKYRIVVLMPSRVRNFHKRMVVRSTWANLTSFSARFDYTFVFLVGKTDSPTRAKMLEAEKKMMRDVVVINMDDTYQNLTLKMQAGFQWVANAINASPKCQNTKYVFKIDDDTYVQLENMERRLRFYMKKRGYNGELYGGRCTAKAHVVRDPKNKFYADESEVPYDFFPPYCEGPFYLMTPNLVRNISQHCWSKPFLKFEDVFFAQCIQDFYPGVKFINVSLKLINLNLPSGIKLEDAYVHKYSVAVHPLTVRSLMKIHERFHPETNADSIQEKLRTTLSKFKQVAFGETMPRIYIPEKRNKGFANHYHGRKRRPIH